jgi:hypothetical protein
MEPRKYVAYNQTRECLLSSSVTTVNAGLEPLKVLKVLIEGLPANSRTGLWLTNFKGVPVARTLSPFDLVYLDKENRVVHGVELSKDGEFTPFKGEPASALVLPPKSLATSKTREGDQLELRLAEPEVQLDTQAESLPAPIAAPVPSTRASQAPSQPIESIPAELSPSARFFSPSEIAPRSHIPEPASEPALEPFSAADSRRATPVAFPAEPSEAGFTSSVEDVAAENKELSPGQFASLHQPFWPQATTRARSQVPPYPVSTPESPASIEQPSNIAAAPVSPNPVQEWPIAEPPVTVPQYGGYGPAPIPKYSWKVRLLRWLFPDLVIREVTKPQDRRRADRQSLSGLIAYYFTGGSPEPHKIGNISVTGFYLHTDERWMPGTIVRMTLQRAGSKGDDPSDTITVNSKIVRWGSDGEGFEFILTDLDE